MPTVTVNIEAIPKYEQMAPKFKAMRDAGKSIYEIASHHKIAWQVAWEILHYAETGETPQWHFSEDQVRYAGWDYFEELAPLVAELHDAHHGDWSSIAKKVKKRTGRTISPVTAHRAYEHAHRREIRKKAGIGTEFKPRSGTEKFSLFKKLLDNGITNGAELARRTGISRNTANRWKNRSQRS